MKKQLWIKILFIILIVLGSIIIDMPNGPNIKLGNWHREIKVHLGLDLQGGTHMVYELDMSKIESEDFDDAAQSVVDVIEKRVNVLGVSEPIVQSAKISGKYNIIVELPGIKDIEQAQ